jgi:aminomuconate-semialdehyde/2-hydroxymuconate-6-semialdehyde dehydrogenase
MIKILNFINGEFQQSSNGLWLDNVNPATGKTFSQISSSSEVDVKRAVDAAEKAFPIWSQKTIEEKKSYFEKIIKLMQENFAELAIAETMDTGKPISISKTVDIPRAIKNLEFYMSAIEQWSSEAHVMNGQAINYTLREPLGVVCCISPWNLPLYLLTWKIAPALLTGNTVVAKPSEVTPYTAFLFAQICQKAGLPPGVLNIIHGTGKEAGEPIILDPRVKALSFTGSTKTGRLLGNIAASKMIKYSLEMGGKNPTIIFESCDLEKAVSLAARAAFSNQGQICLCGSRILVARKIFEVFKQKLIKKIEQIKIGDPLDEKNHFSALVSPGHYQKVLSYIELAKSEGGKILTGGSPLKIAGLDGYFIAPTLIENLGPNCRTNQEEIFGPVATLMPFDTEEEAVELANATDFGLSASLCTNDLGQAQRVSQKIKCGIIWINSWMVRDLRTPFGGMKDSGVGREGGNYALSFFTETKNVCMSY